LGDIGTWSNGDGMGFARLGVLWEGNGAGGREILLLSIAYVVSYEFNNLGCDVGTTTTISSSSGSILFLCGTGIGSDLFKSYDIT
jgi:hypothetical protein